MQPVSELYTQLLEQDNHYFETKAIIDGNEYLEDQLFSASTSIEPFKDQPAVGATPSQEVTIAIRNPNVDFQRMASIKLYVRVVGRLSASSPEVTSEWLPQGEFFSDTKQTTKNDGGVVTCSIHGYDAMLKAEADYSITALTWPAVDTNIVNEIASMMGISVDPRTYDIMTSHYTLPLPTGYSLREILSIIAAKYLGFFYITDAGKLLLQSILSLPPDTSLLINELGNYITFGGTRIIL